MTVKVEDLLLRGHSGNPYVLVTHPSSGPGRVRAGDLVLVLAAGRHPVDTGAAPFMSHPASGWETVDTFVSQTFQSGIFYHVCDGTEPGSTFRVYLPNNNTNAVHIIRLSKTRSQHAWRVQGLITTPLEDVEILGAKVLSGGQSLSMQFHTWTSSAMNYWTESYDADGNLLGLPQELSVGSNSAGHGYRRRVSVSAVDGLPGVGPGVDGIPFVPGDAEPPSTPGNLRLTNKTHNSVRLAWNPSTDNAFVTGYILYQGSTSIATLGPDAISYTRTGLAPSSNYNFRVRARDAGGNISGYSNQLAVKTAAAPAPPPPPPPPPPSPSQPSPPGAPPRLWTSNRGATSITFAWREPNVGGPIDRYGMFKNGSRFGSQVGDRDYVWSGLTPGRSYRFGVRSEGPGGNSSIQSLTASTVSPPSKKTYERLWTATWSDAYRSNGSPSSTGNSALYHGYGDSFNGNQRSLIGFNDGSIRSALSGSEILSVTLRIYVAHTYWNAGSTFRFGYHDYGGRPGSWSGSRVTLTTSKFAQKGSYVSVSLPTSIGVRLRNGSARGIALGPGSSTSSNYYGFCGQAGSSNPPKLIIKYRK